MSKLPERLTMLKIEHAIESVETVGRASNHIGPSMLGNECTRAVWYDFRNYTKKVFSARIIRLFGRGHNEEPIVISDLEQAGVKVNSTQEKFVFAAGHGNAYTDGNISNVPDAPKTPHLLEIKTANNRNFIKFQKHGVEGTNLRYWVQIHLYMKLAKLKRCLYIVVNKDTDERWYQRYKYNPKVARLYMGIAIDVVNSKTPPKKNTSYKCRWCDHNPVCQGNALPQKTCRSCSSLEPMDKGKWYCHKRGKNINFERQQKACKRYSVIR